MSWIYETARGWGSGTSFILHCKVNNFIHPLVPRTACVVCPHSFLLRKPFMGNKRSSHQYLLSFCERFVKIVFNFYCIALFNSCIAVLRLNCCMLLPFCMGLRSFKYILYRTRMSLQKRNSLMQLKIWKIKTNLAMAAKSHQKNIDLNQIVKLMNYWKRWKVM